MAKPRVCVIGAGPGGVSALYQFTKQDEVPDLVCFEKQATWGGLWNFSWRTGTDEYGEICHAGMYRNLWTNAPKEIHEYPDYPFEVHFGKPVPSFPSREVFRDYLEGRWTKTSTCDLKKFIRFSTVVQHVEYNKNSDDFAVTVKDLKTNKSFVEVFSHVIVATGIFNVPKVEHVEGIDNFVGRVFHAHNFRDAREFEGQRVLLIGSKYSAEDLALQISKFGGKRVVISYKKAMGYKWPAAVQERPDVQRFEGNIAFFKDSSSEEFDAVIFCTGYLYSFPFMEESLRLKSSKSFYPDNLYKGVLWLNGGNNKVFYIGTHDQYFSFCMFDVQGAWVSKFINHTLPGEPVSLTAMKKDVEKWRAKASNLNDSKAALMFQTEYMEDICHMTGYKLNCRRVAEMFCQWEEDKKEDVTTYRDKSFTCIVTNTKAPMLGTPWMKVKDPSVEFFLK